MLHSTACALEQSDSKPLRCRNMVTDQCWPFVRVGEWREGPHRACAAHAFLFINLVKLWKGKGYETVLHASHSRLPSADGPVLICAHAVLWYPSAFEALSETVSRPITWASCLSFATLSHEEWAAIAALQNSYAKSGIKSYSRTTRNKKFDSLSPLGFLLYLPAGQRASRTVRTNTIPCHS